MTYRNNTIFLYSFGCILFKFQKGGIEEYLWCILIFQILQLDGRFGLRTWPHQYFNLRAIQCKFKNNPKTLDCIIIMLLKICRFWIHRRLNWIDPQGLKKRHLSFSLDTTSSLAGSLYVPHKNERRSRCLVLRQKLQRVCKLQLGFAARPNSAYLIPLSAEAWSTAAFI